MNYLQDIWANNHIKIEKEGEEKMKQKITKKSYKKENRGITLVALVVTIVVLLILSGITITVLFGDNSIIKSAEKAKTETERDQGDTELGLQNLANDINKYTGSGSGEGGSEEIYTKEDIGTLVGEGKKYAKYTDTTGTAYIPEGYGIVLGDNNTVASGLVISDKAGDTMANDGGGDPDKKGNQFVWVPVPEISQMAVLQNGSTTDYRGKLYEFTGTGTAITATHKESWISGTTYNREPDVLTKEMSPYSSDYGKDGSDMNSIFLEQAGITIDLNGDGNKDVDDFEKQLQNEFNSMVESVKLYGGFYIGRYETGNISSNDKNKTPVVQKGNEKLGGLNWYCQYKNSKKIAVNENVMTSMVWGCQWDATLRWFLTSANNSVKTFVINSTGKGNYKDTNEDKKIATGHEGYDVNNIFDMGGNLWEWTLEAFGTGYRVSRRRKIRDIRLYVSSFIPQQ